MVSEVDLSSNSMTVDDVVYRVESDCRIQKFNGRPATLSEIRVPVRGPLELIESTRVDYIRFEAVRKASGWYMQQITILEGPVS